MAWSDPRQTPAAAPHLGPAARFTGRSDGLYPYAGLAVGQDGSLYGTTRDGGNTGACAQNPGCGVAFQLIPPRDSHCPWQEKILHRFAASDGWSFFAPLVIDKDGELFGTTYHGGDSEECIGGCGVVFATSTKHRMAEEAQGSLR